MNTNTLSNFQAYVARTTQLGDPYAITYVSGPCSSGKTHALIDYLEDEFSRPTIDEPQQFMYVGSTKDLLTQVSRQLTDRGITAQTTIASFPGQADVFERLTEHLGRKDLYAASHITLVTHASFLRLPIGLRDPQRWRIFIDEIPQIDHFQIAVLPKGRELIGGYVEDHTFTEKLVRVEPKQGAGLKALLGMKDTCVESMKEMLYKVESSNFSVYADSAAFERVFECNATTPDKDFSLPILGIVKPEVFEGCCIMSADFEGSILHDMLTRHKKRPAPNNILSKKLRYTTYPADVGQRAQIRYLLEDRHYSKRLRETKTSTGEFVKEEMDRTILTHIGHDRFLLVANNDDTGELVKSPLAERLSGTPHGLNRYQHHTRIVFLAALNLQPKHYEMLRATGFHKNSIQRAHVIQAAHQSAMRTALRDPSSTANVEIIVPDKRTALELGHILNCQNISRLGAVSLPKTTPYNNQQKNQRSKFQKQFNSLQSNKSKKTSSHSSAGKLLPFSYNNNGKSNKNAALSQIATNNIVSGICITLFPTVSATSNQHTEFEFPPTQLRSFLNNAAKAPITKKEESRLISFATFNNASSKSHRTHANISTLTGIVIDVDDGQLTPAAVEDIFWHNAGKSRRRSFIICNTFSRKGSQPNKFRIIFPFKRPTSCIEAYRGIFDAIEQRIIEAGYSKDLTGIDRVSRNPTHPYYLPCTNRAEPNSAFFRSFGMQAREFERHAIDPTPYEVCTPIATPIKPAPSSKKRKQSPKIVSAMKEADDMKKTIQSMSGDRHNLLFQYGVLLHRTIGLTLREVEIELLDIAGRDPALKKKARDVIASLSTRP